MNLDWNGILVLCHRMERVLRKEKVKRDWILYVNPERDVIPAAMLSALCFPGSLVAAASPEVIGTNKGLLSKAILFSVIADANFFGVYEAMRDVYGVNIPTVAFYKTIDDPRYWLEIIIREEVKIIW